MQISINEYTSNKKNSPGFQQMLEILKETDCQRDHLLACTIDRMIRVVVTTMALRQMINTIGMDNIGGGEV